MILFLIFILFSCSSSTKVDLSVNIPIKSGVLDFAPVDAITNGLTLIIGDDTFGPNDYVTILGTTASISVDGEISNVKSYNGTASFVGNTITYQNTEYRSDILEIDYEKDNQIRKDLREIRVNKNTKTCLGIYIAGDNNLNGSTDINIHRSDLDFVWKDLKEITEVSFNSDDLIVVVYLDLHSAAENSYANTSFSSSGLYVIENGVVERVRNVSEPNTGNKETLKYFLNAMKSFANTNRNILDLWGHGLSIFGVCFDDNLGPDSQEVDSFLGNDGLLPSEIKAALDETDSNIDVALFSACLMMDLGVLWDMKDRVKAVSGSADYVPGVGSFYGNASFPGIVGYLANIPEGANHNDIAIKISEINYESFSTPGQQDYRGTEVDLFLTQSAVDQSKIEAVKNALKDLVDSASPSQITATNVFSNTLFYYQKDYTNPTSTIILDAVSLSNALSNLGAGATIKSKALVLKNALNEYVIYSKHKLGYENIGVSLLAPLISSTSVRDIINNNSFYSTTGWRNVVNNWNI